MVAVHGKLLEHTRFFGFYKKSQNGYDIPIDNKDQIAKLLLRLFPSPDGAQFVANAGDDLIGMLSKKLYHINDIIKTLISKGSQKEKITSIRKILTLLGETKPRTMSAGEFAKILVNAYEQDQRGDQRYPKNIVIISLLSFFAKVADDKSQLIEGLPVFFKEKRELYEPFSYFVIKTTLTFYITL